MKINKGRFDIISNYGYGDWGYDLKNVTLKEVYLYFKNNKGYTAEEVRGIYDGDLGTFWVDAGTWG